MDYPTLLEPKQWQSHKGIIAKLTKSTKETGIEKLLTDLRQDFSNLKLEKCYPGGYGKIRTLPELEANRAAAKQHHMKAVVGYSRKLANAKPQVLEVAKKFEDARLIPSSSTRYVKSIADALSTFSTELLGLVREIDPRFDAARDRVKMLWQMATDNLTKAVAELKEGLQAAKDTPTVEVWENQCKQQCRSCGNALGNVPTLKARFWGTWQPIDGMQVQHYGIKSHTQEELARFIKNEANRVLNLIPALEQAISHGG
jgi:hypothetical protein